MLEASVAPFAYLVDNSGDAAFGECVVIGGAVDGTGVTFHGEAYGVSCTEVFGKHVDEDFEAVAVVLDFVVEEVVKCLVDRVALSGVGQVLVGCLVLVSQEHIAVVGLEVGRSGSGVVGMGVWLVVVEVEFDGEEGTYGLLDYIFGWLYWFFGLFYLGLLRCGFVKRAAPDVDVVAAEGIFDEIGFATVGG